MEEVLHLARLSFVQFQAALDRAGLLCLAALATAPLLEDLRSRLAERGPGPNHTEVLQLETRLLMLQQLREAFVASVEFSGLIRERLDATAALFRELWLLANVKAAGRGWQLAAGAGAVVFLMQRRCGARHVPMCELVPLPHPAQGDTAQSCRHRSAVTLRSGRDLEPAPRGSRAATSIQARWWWLNGAPQMEHPRTQPMNLTMLNAGPAARRWLPVAALAAAVLLVGCGDKKEKAASQTAVKVNKDEITVHQINFVMQQQRNLRPEQADAASKQILERLIDQQLAVQRADDLKLDRDPRVVQQLEAVRREVLARAYVEKVGEAATKPTPEEIKKYYDEKPALFSDRRIYSIQEIAIEAKPEQVQVLRDQLAASKSINEFVEYLKANDFKFSGNQAVRAAEQLPLNSLESFSRMKDGQAAMVPAANGVQVVVLAGSRSQPVSEEQARPAIEQFLLNERKRKLVEEDMKSLRTAAAIEYVGKFAELAASAPAAVPPAATVVPAAPAASSGLSATDITKGMGLK